MRLSLRRRALFHGLLGDLAHHLARLIVSERRVGHLESRPAGLSLGQCEAPGGAYDLAPLERGGALERWWSAMRLYCPIRSVHRVLFDPLSSFVSLVKLRARLLGPLATLATDSSSHRPRLQRNSVDAAFHQVDTALDHLCVVLGLQHAA